MTVARATSRLSVVLVAVSISLVVADGGIYLGFILEQDEGGPAWWFVVGLLIVIVLELGTLRRTGPHSVALGIAGGVILLGLGVLGIFSVGLPLLAAGILLLVAAPMRSRAGSAPVPTVR